MSNSIKIDLYEAVRDTLAALLKAGPGSPVLFKYVGHYNSPELDNENNFAYRTPAAFIALNTVNWQETRPEAPSLDLTREQNGLATLTVHYFIHDLRTDTDSYVEHLTTINRGYRALIGLRSTAAIDGKFSSLRRVNEVDDNAFANLRHWRQTYTSWVQEPPTVVGQVDASPVALNIIPVKP